MSTGLDRNERMIHIRHEGQSHDVAMTALDLGDLSTDREVFTALATHLDVPVEKFNNYRVDREPGGSLTVRPQAVFG